MSDLIVFDDGVRFTEINRVRVPADLRERVEATAKAANLSQAHVSRNVAKAEAKMRISSVAP